MSPTDVLEKPDQAVALRDHLIKTVSGLTLERDPFCHVYSDAFWPPALYPQLLKNLPDPKLYEPQNIKKWVRADGTSTRDNFFLTAPNIAKLAPDAAALWTSIAAAVSDEGFKRALFAKLAPDLADRFAVPVAQVPDIPCVRELLLVRDLEEYEIKPHPDGINKIVTLQIYLPEDDTRSDLGTSLYKLHKSLFAKRFEEVKRFKFLPNSAYAFVVSDSKQRVSWHGREKISNFNGVRNTLMVIFQSKTERAYEY